MALKRLGKFEQAIRIDRLFDSLEAAQIVGVVSRPPILQRWVGKILVGAAGREPPHRFIEAILPVAVARHHAGAIDGAPKQADVEEPSTGAMHERSRVSGGLVHLAASLEEQELSAAARSRP